MEHVSTTTLPELQLLEGHLVHDPLIVDERPSPRHRSAPPSSAGPCPWSGAAYTGMRSKDRVRKPDNYGLFRLDLSTGAETVDLERVAKGVAAVGVIDDGLVVGQIKSTSDWRPATFDATSGEFGILDIPLGKKDTFGGGITVGDGLIAFLDDKKPLVYDPTSGTLTRLKMPKYWDLGGEPLRLTWELHGGEVLTRGGLWVASQGFAGRVSVLPMGTGGPEVDPGCHPSVYNEAQGTCPVIVGSTPGAVWTVTDVDPETLQMGPWMLRRLDTQSGAVTLAVDATDLITPEAVRLYAEGVS